MELGVRTRARHLAARYFEERGARLLHALKLTPMAVTLMGLSVSAVAAYLAAIGYFLPAALVLLLAGIMDMLDGALARLTNGVSVFGAALDSFADRIAEGLLLLGLLIFFLDEDTSVGVVLVFLVFMASYMVSYLRARAEGLGINMGEVGLFTRTERVLVIVLGLLTNMANLVLVALAIVLVLSVFTSGQRLYHVWRHARGE